MSDHLIKDIFRWPGNPRPITLDNSVILTLDKSSDNFPVISEFNNEIMQQLIWVLIYVLIWAFIVTFITIHQGFSITHFKRYIIGFVVGLIISILDVWMSSNLTSIFFNNNTKAYIFNTPYIVDTLLGKLNKKDDMLIPKYGTGDYKILTKNKIYPKSEKYGYIIQADEYLKQENLGNISGTDYVDFLQNKHNNDIENKIGNVFLSHLNNMESISYAAYCVGIIIITWSIYISASKWGNKYHILWLVISLIMVVITAGLINSAKTIVECNNIVFVKQRILILAISFGIASVLIS